MQHPVVAVGIDGPNFELFAEWLADGLMPNIGAIAAQGITVTHTHEKRFRNERCWGNFLTGRDLPGTGSTFLPSQYRYFNQPIQREGEPPFYGLGPGHRVCIFDLPAPLSERVDGLQVSGWGSELNASVPMSAPDGLIQELITRHGDDPKMAGAMRVLGERSGDPDRSFRNPSLYSVEDLRRYQAFLALSIERRTNICLDLLARGPWNLFLGLYTESHTANHLFWHIGQPYPIPSPFRPGEDPLRDLFSAIDRGIGRILRALSADTSVVVFTIDDTGPNCMDVPSMALLPEILYRWNRPGGSALFAGAAGEPLPPARVDYRDHWKNELWALRTPEGARVLASPLTLEARGEALGWNPACWYQPLWPDLRAFALPSVSDGHIRLNVIGREANGQVTQTDFDATIAEIIDLLEQLTDPRTGQPAVLRVIRTREHPLDAPHVPPDLVVRWRDAKPIDTLDSPQVGRVGPAPYFRSGGHRGHGARIENLLVARGPGIEPGSTAPTGRLEDLSATLLHLMGAKSPIAMDGVPLFTRTQALTDAAAIRS